MSSEKLFIDCHLKVVKIMFLCGGMSLGSRRWSLRDKVKSRSVYALNFLWLNTDVLGAIVWFADGLANGTDIVGLARVAPCLVFSFLANFKGYYLVRHEDRINEVVDTLKELEIKVNARRETVEEQQVFKEETNFLAIVIKMSNILNAILITTFALSPLILIAYKYMKTKELDLVLPFLIIYPFDSKDLRIWPFVYLRQIWSECIVVLNVCVSDYLFYVCCTFIRIQFRLLQHNVENITRKHSPLEHMEVNLIDLIEWHQECIRLSNVLEVIYTEATLFNFLCSSVLICLTGFSVIAVDDVAFGMTFLVFLSSSLLQIFLLCFFGDMLMRSSADVMDAVYKCKWHQMNPTIKKNFLLMLTRAQKPCKLTASGFADVNLPAFTKILSSAWSYFALLKTMYSSAHI